MNAHPDTQFAVSELRRNEFLRTAHQERLAAIARKEPTRSRHAAAWGLARGIAATLSFVAARMGATSHRTQPVLLPQPR